MRLCSKAKLLVSGVLLLGCGPGPDPLDGFTQQEWDKVQSLSPLPPAPKDTTNRYADDPKAAALGQKLFWDKSYSGPLLVDSSVGRAGERGKVNCATCHAPSAGFADERRDFPTSVAANWVVGRNTLPLLNLGHYEWSGWQGFIDTMWGHALLGIEAPVANNTSRLEFAHFMWNNYRAEYDEIFDPDLPPQLDPSHPEASRFPPAGKPKAAGQPDGPWENMRPEDRAAVERILANAGKAIGAYLRKLVSTNSSFDKYVAGDKSAMTASAKRGLKLFIGKAACIECHEGPDFSDNKFHNDGVPQMGERIPNEDLGRYAGIQRLTGPLKIWSSEGPYSDDTTLGRLTNLVPTEEDKGRFRTKALRSVALTAPYMHTGAFKTLREVVEHYNRGGADSGFAGVKSPLLKPLNLTEQEMDDLVAFLESLTGEPLPQSLTSAPTP